MKKEFIIGILISGVFFFTGCEHKVLYVNVPQRTTCTSFNHQIDCDNPKASYFYTEDLETRFPVTYKKSYTKKCVSLSHLQHDCPYYK